MDARCPQCGQTIRLPGQLSAIATIRSERRKDPLGLGLEALGFISMFFFFPWGAIVGGPMVYMGWRKSNVLRCSNCQAQIAKRDVQKCPGCRASFSED